MAITKVAQYTAGAPVDTDDWAGHSAHITAYITQMMNQPILLTEWTTTTVPEIAQHVYLAHAGTLYQVDTADFDIATGDLDGAGNYWVKLTTSGDTLTVAWEDDISGFAWNHAYQGLYSGTSQILPYMVYFNGTADYTKYRYDFGENLVLDNLRWEVIKEISENGLAEKYFIVGDRKNIVVDGYEITLQIYGFGHDDKVSGGKAGITFGMEYTMNDLRQMNSASTNVGGWESSDLRTWCNGTLYQMLPSDLLASIKTVKKPTADGGSQEGVEVIDSEDDVFLFSEVEVSGNNDKSHAGEGSLYPIFTDAASRIKKRYVSNYNWWLRSPGVAEENIFCAVRDDAEIIWGNSTNVDGVVFGFCV